MEKKIVVYDLRLSYNGPFSIEEFYKEIDLWAKEKGMEKELKENMDHHNPSGRQIKWAVELWKDIHEDIKGIVRLQAMFNNVKEIETKKNGKKIRYNNAEVLMIFDGIQDSDLHTRWEQNSPIFYFLRTLFDKYIWSVNPAEKYTGIIWGDTHDLFKRLKSFFNISKQKYQ